MVNEHTGHSGPGAFDFVNRYLQDSPNRTLLKGDEKACVEEALSLIFNYPKWDDVALYFDVKIGPKHFDRDKEPPISLPVPTGHRSGPESDEHKALKKWVSEHPEFFAPRFNGFRNGLREMQILSGDRLDVYFSIRHSEFAAEVKAANVPPSEYFRGILQCVKYRAVLQATQLAEGKIPNAQAVLVTQHSLPSEAVRLSERLQVLVFVAPEF